MQNKKLKFKPVALPCERKGSTKLFTTNLFSGECPHLCKYCYAQGFRIFLRCGPRPISLEAIKNNRKWPRQIFLSSASDPFHPIVIKQAEELCCRALPTGSLIIISTKALATQKIVEILSRYSDQVSYTVSLSNLCDERNSLLEPYAPSALERLHGKLSADGTILCGIEQLVQAGLDITLKADTLFPGIDDSEERISRLLEKAKKCGIKSVNFSYTFYRNRFKKKLKAIPLLKDSLAAMDQDQEGSGKCFSLPVAEKKKRLSRMALIANDLGYKVISTCACKNQIGTIPNDIPMRLHCHFHDKWF